MPATLDNEAIEAKKEKVRAFLADNCDDFERAFSYYYLYNTGIRIDGLERKLLALAPRKSSSPP